MDVMADENQDVHWDNISNITEVNEITAIEMNSVDETLLIRRSLEILEYGILNSTHTSSIWPSESDFFYDMDWNDYNQKLAYAHSGSFSSPSNLWNSPLVIINKDGDPIDGEVPYGRIQKYESIITDIEWRPERDHLAVGYQDGNLNIINCTDGSFQYQHIFHHQIKRCKWNPDGTMLVVVVTDILNSTDKVYVWDIYSNNSWRTGGSWTIHDIDWSYDGRFLIVSENKKVHMLDVANGTLEEIWDSGGWFIASNPTDPLLVIHGYWSVNIMNYLTQEVATYHSYHEQLHIGGWTQDGSYFFTLDDADVIHIWTEKSVIPRPKVGILAPTSDYNVSGSIVIEGWAESSAPSTLSVVIRIGQNDWSIVDGTLEWTYGYDTTMSPDGPLIIRVKAVDYSGFSDVRTLRVFVKNSASNPNAPPTISIQSPNDGAIVWGIVEIKGEAVDDETIISIQIRTNRVGWNPIGALDSQPALNWTYYLDITTMRESSFDIQARAFDGYQFSDVAQVKVTVKPPSPDEPPLMVSIVYPKPGVTVPKDFTVLGRIEQGYADEIFLSIDNGQVLVIPGTPAWNFIFKDVDGGPHFISVIARNEVTWSQWIVLSFFVDASIPVENQPPTIGIISPKDNASFNTDFSIIGWSLDDMGVVENEIYIDGTWMRMNGTDSWHYNLSIDALSEGWVVFQVRAFDGSNHSEPASVSLLILRGEDNNNDVQDPSNDYLLIIGILIIAIIVLVGFIIKTKTR
jgi:hypothetical protein